MTSRTLAPTELHELVLFLVERLGNVGRTKLTKLLYLIDEAHFARFGTTLTGGTWVRFTYGPMLLDLPRVTRELGQEIAVEEWTDETGTPHADYRITESTPRFRPQLRKHELQLVNEVLSRYSDVPLTDLLRIVYSTAPMRLIRKWEEGGERLNRVAIPFARALGSLDEGLSRYRRIADAVRETSTGSIAAHAAHDRKVLRATASLRRSAMAAELAQPQG